MLRNWVQTESEKKGPGDLQVTKGDPHRPNDTFVLHAFLFLEGSTPWKEKLITPRKAVIQMDFLRFMVSWMDEEEMTEAQLF